MYLSRMFAFVICLTGSIGRAVTNDPAQPLATLPAAPDRRPLDQAAAAAPSRWLLAPPRRLRSPATAALLNDGFLSISRRHYYIFYFQRRVFFIF
ncbi:hypothetical protein PVAP13_2NG296703 [Panicum virgatum]|uniref:Secreted protein n=1 Tax=Panicum virgatum TaxID=38727 RepID=A0A8T0VBK7_PANVG|nr:hypothetical protein PVAP13_2NG296703 [Panicum virgatum]